MDGSSRPCSALLRLRLCLQWWVKDFSCRQPEPPRPGSLTVAPLQLTKGSANEGVGQYRGQPTRGSANTEVSQRGDRPIQGSRNRGDSEEGDAQRRGSAKQRDIGQEEHPAKGIAPLSRRCLSIPLRSAVSMQRSRTRSAQSRVRSLSVASKMHSLTHNIFGHTPQSGCKMIC